MRLPVIAVIMMLIPQKPTSRWRWSCST